MGFIQKVGLLGIVTPLLLSSSVHVAASPVPRCDGLTLHKEASVGSVDPANTFYNYSQGPGPDYKKHTLPVTKEFTQPWIGGIVEGNDNYLFEVVDLVSSAYNERGTNYYRALNFTVKNKKTLVNGDCSIVFNPLDTWVLDRESSWFDCALYPDSPQTPNYWLDQRVLFRMLKWDDWLTIGIELQHHWFLNVGPQELYTATAPFYITNDDIWDTRHCSASGSCTATKATRNVWFNQDNWSHPLDSNSGRLARQETDHHKDTEKGGLKTETEPKIHVSRAFTHHDSAPGWSGWNSTTKRDVTEEVESKNHVSRGFTDDDGTWSGWNATAKRDADEVEPKVHSPRDSAHSGETWSGWNATAKRDAKNEIGPNTYVPRGSVHHDENEEWSGWNSTTKRDVDKAEPKTHVSRGFTDDDGTWSGWNATAKRDAKHETASKIRVSQRSPQHDETQEWSGWNSSAKRDADEAESKSREPADDDGTWSGWNATAKRDDNKVESKVHVPRAAAYGGGDWSGWNATAKRDVKNDVEPNVHVSRGSADDDGTWYGWNATEKRDDARETELEKAHVPRESAHDDGAWSGWNTTVGHESKKREVENENAIEPKVHVSRDSAHHDDSWSGWNVTAKREVDEVEPKVRVSRESAHYKESQEWSGWNATERRGLEE